METVAIKILAIIGVIVLITSLMTNDFAGFVLSVLIGILVPMYFFVGCKMKIVRNMVRCKKCNSVIESKSVHDFKQCKCGNIFVDGGLEYLRRGGKALGDKSYEELSVTK